MLRLEMNKYDIMLSYLSSYNDFVESRLRGGKEMDYEVVFLEEKMVAGLRARTKNDAPDMGVIIGGMWQRLYGEGILQKIEGKINEHTIAFYDAYESNANGLYDVTIGAEVKRDQQDLQELVVKRIPKGKYARFLVEGPMESAVCQFWSKLWKMPLERTYSGDFEEYVDGDEVNCKAYIYIGIK